MSVQNDIETALAGILETAISGLEVVAGTRSGPQLEGNRRRGTVRRDSGSNERLAFGQNDWTESYEIVVLWSPKVLRENRITEWAAVEAALLADQYLGGSIAGLSDSYLSEYAFGEPIEAQAYSVVARVEIRRVE